MLLGSFLYKKKDKKSITSEHRHMEIKCKFNANKTGRNERNVPVSCVQFIELLLLSVSVCDHESMNQTKHIECVLSSATVPAVRLTRSKVGEYSVFKFGFCLCADRIYTKCAQAVM